MCSGQGKNYRFHMEPLFTWAHVGYCGVALIFGDVECILTVYCLVVVIVV